MCKIRYITVLLMVLYSSNAFAFNLGAPTPILMYAACIEDTKPFWGFKVEQSQYEFTPMVDKGLSPGPSRIASASGMTYTIYVSGHRNLINEFLERDVWSDPKLGPFRVFSIDNMVGYEIGLSYGSVGQSGTFYGNTWINGIPQKTDFRFNSEHYAAHVGLLMFFLYVNIGFRHTDTEVVINGKRERKQHNTVQGEIGFRTPELFNTSFYFSHKGAPVRIKIDGTDYDIAGSTNMGIAVRF